MATSGAGAQSGLWEAVDNLSYVEGVWDARFWADCRLSANRWHDIYIGQSTHDPIAAFKFTFLAVRFGRKKADTAERISLPVIQPMIIKLVPIGEFMLHLRTK